jgi:hypothetical protein
MIEKDRKDYKDFCRTFKTMGDLFKTSMAPSLQVYAEFQESIDKVYKPSRETMKKFEEWRENLITRLKPTLDIIEKIQRNQKEAKEIRGEVVTSIIDLDDALKGIILKKYIKDEVLDEFSENMLDDEACSIFLKYKVLVHSGLLEKDLRRNVQTLIEIRNTLAHSKYRPTIETIQVLHKRKVKDISSLKQEFDSIFEHTMKQLEEICRTLR